jgi:UDP:flavonoid glycosyltransferase YjiC (YdhE family)
MRVLLSTTSGAGHFRPLLPVARALRRAGHELACAAPVEAAGMVEREGLRHLPFDGVPPDHPDRGAAFGRAPTLPPAEARRLVGAEVFGRLNTTYALPGAQAAVAEFAPDLVVHETGEAATRIAAECAGISVVGVNPSLSLAAFVTAMAEGTAALRAGLGLDPDADGRQALAMPCLSWFPAEFDVPGAPFGDVRRHRDADLPGVAPTEDRDLVYVTLGSEALGIPFFAPVLRQAVAGALDAGLPVLVATGKEADPALLAGLEGDLTVRTWVDQTEVLRRARVVVCHVGAGTTLGALAAGVPLVAVPLFADQPDLAERVAAVACGRVVAPGPDLPDEVAAAVRGLAAQAPAGTAAVAAQVAALPPVDDAVPWLESLAR